jgi:hypothetical protein
MQTLPHDTADLQLSASVWCLIYLCRIFRVQSFQPWYALISHGSFAYRRVLDTTCKASSVELNSCRSVETRCKAPQSNLGGLKTTSCWKLSNLYSFGPKYQL